MTRTVPVLDDTNSDLEIVERLSPLHPGEMLHQEFMLPLTLTAGTLAKALGVPRTRIERLVRQEVDLSADTALRLARYFNMSPEFWMGVQSRYAIDKAEDTLMDKIQAIVPRAA